MLGPYRLDQFVGGGGMGAVFRALDTTLDRTVAVKVLAGRQADDEEMLKRFRNEAQSAARLDHENIGRVHAVGSEDGWHYIVFEFIEGTNLRELVREEGPFDLTRTVDIAIQVADALEHASERDVVHRDIKPSNIVITPTGRARIVDMGLARLPQVADDRDLTVSGMTLGTFDYISPEQARDPRAADVRSDLYSLGCTIFYTLTGRPPFADGTMVQKLLQHQQDAPPPIESLRPDVPKRFGLILAKLMEKDPKDRYQRPAMLVADLIGMADELGIELASPRPLAAIAVEPASPIAPVHLPWLIPLLGLTIVIGGLWLRGGGARSASEEGLPHTQSAAISEPGGASSPTTSPSTGLTATAATAPATLLPRVWRIVDDPTVADECETVGEAVRQASDGDVIEVACDEPRDDGPFSIEGKHLTIRAALGMQPILRFGEAGAIPRDGGCCTVVSGTLELRDVTLRSSFLPVGGVRPACVCLRGSASLVCDRVLFVTPAEAAAAGVCVRSEQSPGDRQEIRTSDTRADGGTFLDAKGGGHIDLFWSGGRVVTSGRFLLAEGSPSSNGSGTTIRMTLENGLFACGDGFACLLDSQALPQAPQLRGFAKACRFLVPNGRPVLEQSGIGDPEAYRQLVEWIDAASRYEGSDVLRRIDGAAERFDIDFASQPQPLNHSPNIDNWPGDD